MNQILKPEINNQKEEINISDYSIKHKKLASSKSNKIYKFQFIFSSLIACFFLIIFFVRIFQMNKNEKISEQLMNQYHISTLYSNNSNYSAQLTDNLSNSSQSTSQTPFVIGIIKIDKIDLNYPILSESNKELLSISPCRFAGPMPNEVGNLCIAGHNYVDYKFFSRLHELNKDDKIKIYDLSGKMVEYSIFDKYETKSDDLSCTSQDTNGKNIITLVTCNNVSGNRLVVVAKPM